MLLLAEACGARTEEPGPEDDGEVLVDSNAVPVADGGEPAQDAGAAGEGETDLEPVDAPETSEPSAWRFVAREGLDGVRSLGAETADEIWVVPQGGKKVLRLTAEGWSELAATPGSQPLAVTALAPGKARVVAASGAVFDVTAESGNVDMVTEALPYPIHDASASAPDRVWGIRIIQEESGACDLPGDTTEIQLFDGESWKVVGGFPTYQSSSDPGVRSFPGGDVAAWSSVVFAPSSPNLLRWTGTKWMDDIVKGDLRDLWIDGDKVFRVRDTPDWNCPRIEVWKYMNYWPGTYAAGKPCFLAVGGHPSGEAWAVSTDGVHRLADTEWALVHAAVSLKAKRQLVSVLPSGEVVASVTGGLVLGVPGPADGPTAGPNPPPPPESPPPPLLAETEPSLTWVEHETPYNHLYEVSGTAKDDLWAAGGYDWANEEGFAFHFDGEGWQEIAGGPDLILRAVTSLGPGKARIVASDGSIYDVEGGIWTAVSSGPPGVEGLAEAAVAPDGTVWAASYWQAPGWIDLTKNEVLRWDGAEWTPALQNEKVISDPGPFGYQDYQTFGNLEQAAPALAMVIEKSGSYCWGCDQEYMPMSMYFASALWIHDGVAWSSEVTDRIFDARAAPDGALWRMSRPPHDSDEFPCARDLRLRKGETWEPAPVGSDVSMGFAHLCAASTDVVWVTSRFGLLRSSPAGWVVEATPQDLGDVYRIAWCSPEALVVERKSSVFLHGSLP